MTLHVVGCRCSTGWPEYLKKTDLLGFPAQQSLRITEDDLKKKKYPVSGSPLGEKV